MENASKALIIAGAILLAIIIVSLGIGVVKSAQKSMQNANVDEYGVEAFNSKFTSIVGTSGQTIDSEDLKNLLQVVVRSNAEERRNGRNRFVVVAGAYKSTTGTNTSLMKASDYVSSEANEGKDPDPTGAWTVPTDISAVKKYNVKVIKGSSGIIWALQVNLL